MIERTIEARTHGRYLVEPVPDGAPAPLLVGFHGYAESAEAQAERLRSIPGSARWTLVAIQGLHRFYNRRSSDVIASWMTRQDRELAIADNIAYVAAVVEAEWAARLGSRGIVFAGFSQGVAMAFRAAAASPRPVAGIVAAGGDIPPELDRDRLACLRHVLLIRGTHDEWYTHEKLERDRERLCDAVVNVTAVEIAGGHEWTADAAVAAAAFLDARLA